MTSNERPRAHSSPILVALAAAMLVGACVQAPGVQPASQGQAPTPGPPVSGPPPAASAPPEPEAVQPPAPPMTAQMIQRTVMAAVEHLEAGEEEAAIADLEPALLAEPGNKLAQSLMRQIKEDPRTLLGRESFAYRVQSGESLSRIAQHFLNDVYLFYALARYNDIKIPRQLAGGQTIRVPGKAPPAATAPAAATTSAPAPVPPPTVPPGPTPAPPAQAATPPASSPAPPDPARAQRERAATVARHTREARSAFAQQDLDGAIRSWDAVLALDPGNSVAQLERQRALDLKARLQRVQ